ncbi:hypothetical protein F383_21517 [Gossypium arboreum]|uniref:Uncharacterized protein n=1 Tax=Gossypium arboreum TaxID=29729 RepID=A0A0B0NZ81_GOSAR|nr:hypothetical protein F383_21517 [Gossypium arboreum]
MHLGGARRVGSKELLKESQLIHLNSRIHHQDWRSPFKFLQEFWVFLCFVVFMLLRCFLS